MHKFSSPLRYPGGKHTLSDFFKEIIDINDLEGGTYVEPFAGGAGAALSLLFSDKVYKIVLNDKDPFIYSFWKAIVEQPEAFIKKIEKTPVTIEEYYRQREILFKKSNQRSLLTVGFAAFYMNRCNRSGMLSAGPIGGKDQTGEWKVDARFNKVDLIKRIERIALFADRIEVYNYDAIDFIEQYLIHLPLEDQKVLVYLDPPYYKKGDDLYRLYFKDEDHVRVAQYFKDYVNFKWIISYDDSKYIRKLYNANNKEFLHFNYFANKAKVGRELVISSENCLLPTKYRIKELQPGVPVKKKVLVKVKK